MIYAFFGVASFWHFYNDRKKISIHFLHGGNLKKMTGKIMSPFVGESVLGRFLYCCSVFGKERRFI